MGRSHHSTRDIIMSVVGGFCASFITFTVATYTNNVAMRGQLLAGDPNLNKEMPTTLNTMHAAMDGNSAILNAMGSYFWWIGVIVVGLIGTFIILKVMRRYA